MAALPATAPRNQSSRGRSWSSGTPGVRALLDSAGGRNVDSDGREDEGMDGHDRPYNAADINEQNLKQYDAVFLDSTTGCFLDDPTDKAATDARRAALIDFIRSGKGIAGIHAAPTRTTAPRAARRLPPAAGRAAAVGWRTRRRRQRCRARCCQPGRQERGPEADAAPS